MVDIQTILFIVLIILTILLLILGIQVFFILKEFRQTVTKANKVLDDTGVITESVSKPISTLSSISTGVKVGNFVANILKRKRKIIDNLTSDE